MIKKGIIFHKNIVKGVINMDELFQSRRDIERLIIILQEWKNENSKDSKIEYTNELLDKLEYLHMIW